MNMATYNRPPFERARKAIAVTGQALLLMFCIFALWATVWLADAIINSPQPTERCFKTATTDTDYCRSQRYWSN